MTNDKALNVIQTDSIPARIPQPPEQFMFGNMFALSASSPVRDMVRLAGEYGGIYRLAIRGKVLVVVSDYDLVNEICDEKRFDKTIRGTLGLIRRFSGDGLFTAKTQEPNWAKAHNILLPNFGHKAMQSYHPMMLDIAEQLCLKWQRLRADEEIDVPRDMTNLAVDTIGLCGFDYRFNSFYHDTEHPFVSAMFGGLNITQDELRDVPLENYVQRNRHKQLQENIRTMNETVDRIIKDRKASGEDLSGKADLLSYMLAGVDRKTGEKLEDTNIRYQIITFLIAGHETTSGMLSFALYSLMKNPHVLERAYAEVDRVLGADLEQKPTWEQVNQLQYVSQILKETLRLYPSVPVLALYPLEDTMIGGKYPVKRSHSLAILLHALHRDKKIWGANPDDFNPDNFAPEREAALPPNSYKPFGNGQRACIGSQFALQEATLVVGMILQRFKLIDHQRYELNIKETLTIKPEGFKIKVRLRRDDERANFVISPSSAVLRQEKSLEQNESIAENKGQGTKHKTQKINRHDTPLLVLFGSNMGTAEEIARRIAQDADENGFSTKVAALDDYAGLLPREGYVFIATSSYNGKPPDNAEKFYHWLEQTDEDLSGITFAVFGCGNRDWAATFQAVPRFVDQKLAASGARRFYDLGEGDAREDFEGQFYKWFKSLRKVVAQELDLQFDFNENQKSLYQLEIVPGAQMSGFVDSFDAQPMRVLTNRELHRKTGVNPSTRSTRHIEFELPENSNYAVGDHLGVVPQNSEELVKRVAARFGFERETYIRLHKQISRKTFLPVEQTISVYRLLRDYVELQEVATRHQIQILTEFTECPPHKIELLALTSDDESSSARFREEILDKRKSILDLLEQYPACVVPFEVYLEMLAPLRPRYYSISSSPLVDPKKCSITVAVVESPARSGHGVFQGVCSNYLARKIEHKTVYAFVKDTKDVFGLPADLTTPLIMIGPGTGVAPFRGFLQERAALKANGTEIGRALLFFGCRHPEQDFLYEGELREFERTGIVELSASFSRVKNQPKCYVQSEIYNQRDQVWQLIEDGARIYVCGDASRMATDVRRTFAQIHIEKTNGDQRDADKWLDEMIRQNRYLLDVWASN